MKSKFIFIVVLLLIAACDNKFDWIKPPVEIPVVDTITPDTGTVGTEVTVTGSHFSITPSKNKITINGTPATIVDVSTTMLLFITPNTTSGPVVVTVNDQNAENKPVFMYK